MNASVLGDQRLGTSYQVIKEVHAALAQILYLADNMDQLSPREIELQQSADKIFLQWRREGDLTWRNLVSIQTLAQSIDTTGGHFGIDDVEDANNYIRSQGVWKPLPALFSGAYADLSGKPNLFSGAYADLSGKPNLFSGAYVDLSGKPTIPVVDVLEAPKNGKQFARKDGAWAEVVSSSSGSGGGFTPLKIAAGTTFIVPDNQQAFLRMAVTVDGTLQLDGYLIEV